MHCLCASGIVVQHDHLATASPNLLPDFRSQVRGPFCGQAGKQFVRWDAFAAHVVFSWLRQLRELDEVAVWVIAVGLNQPAAALHRAENNGHIVRL